MNPKYLTVAQIAALAWLGWICYSDLLDLAQGGAPDTRRQQVEEAFFGVLSALP